MIILNSPHNPTGHVMTREEFQLVACLLTQYCPNAVLVSVRWDARFDFVSAR
jgi:aspartate/methionine/tyrosine aminotransferase